MKQVRFLGNTQKEIQGWSSEVKQQTGMELTRVQYGLMPTNYKPMTTIGTGVYEVRIQVDSQHRVVYTAKFEEAVYVLAAFQKKTQKTKKSEIDKAKTALKTI